MLDFVCSVHGGAKAHLQPHRVEEEFLKRLHCKSLIWEKLVLV